MDGTIREELEVREHTSETAILEQRIAELENALALERENAMALQQIIVRLSGKLTGVIQ